MGYILVVDDEKKMRHLLAIMLERQGHRIEQAEDGQQALDKAIAASFDMVITDIKMPRMDGMALLEKLKEANLPCPVVFITAFATVESAVDAMRLGAADYITKPFEEDRILLTVERTLNLSRVMAENRELRQELHRTAGYKRIVCKSPKMKEAVSLCQKVAKSNSVVCIGGESGTGKELLARFIHDQSNRKKARFVAINCAAISAHLVESEMFGHEKGAFTDASRQTQGKLEFASGGTLFLDEIAELSMEAQAKLLRALQEKKIQRVGGNQEIDIDIRMICATNQHLEQLVAEGRFRRDLFFRVNVFPIELIPLRERRDDVIPLAHHFLERLSPGRPIKLTDGAARMLEQYHWPGNVRELANVMERALILSSDSRCINRQALAFLNQCFPLAKNGGFKLPPEGVSFEALQNDIVKQALELADNNQSLAAQLLGLTRAKFRVLLKNAGE